MSARTLIGEEINAEILKRLARLESLIICRYCEGEGVRPYRHLGVHSCRYCHGTGDRISALENKE